MVDFASFKAAFADVFPVHARGLFDDLIWPAAAGNVAWAFLQAAIAEESDCRALRLALLFFLAIYLTIDWFRSKSLDRKTRLYRTADAIHISSIVTYGVAVASNRSETFLVYNLGAIFVIAVIGHLFGAWEVEGQSRNWRDRIALASCGLLGIAILLVGRFVLHADRLSTLLVAFVVVLIAWVSTRMRIGVTVAAADPVEQRSSAALRRLFIRGRTSPSRRRRTAGGGE